MNKYVNANKAHWNDLVEIHAKSKFYDVEGFKKGRSTLDRVELEGVGDVSGKSLLHLQCHFGMDTLSWARKGAMVTGIDFSPQAIKMARSLSSELAIPATFVCSDIYDLPNQLSKEEGGEEDEEEGLEGGFDIVFTSYGVLPWLSDLKRWGEVIAHFLKPGGTFYIVESHPFAHVFADDSLEGEVADFQVYYPYFNAEPKRFDGQGSYADYDAIVEHPETYEWWHTISEIINSLISAGLRIDSLTEYPFTTYRMLPFMVADDEGFWRLPDGREDVPFMFALQATSSTREGEHQKSTILRAPA